MLSSLSLGVKARQYFVSSSDIFLDKKTLLKIWLNPGLNLTIFRGSKPWCLWCSEFHSNLTVNRLMHSLILSRAHLIYHTLE